MTRLSLRARGVGKMYEIGVRRPLSIRDLMSRSAEQGLGRKAPGADRFWALRDVSFEIEHGEAWGIIGRNGAGKSTLLKILSRITEPTEGSVEVTGRVSSLLEVGTGFHADLSGRDNVFLNGAILGMRRAEIARKFDEIVAFAEVEKFVDTPVKHYSTGMYMRLAFAVAAHLEPEILVVDEVLAVGDAAFQKKCLGKLEQAAKGGRTVLFVSHNMTAIRALCTSAMQLADGRIHKIGPAADVVGAYLTGLAAVHAERTWPAPQEAPGDERCRLRAVRILDHSGAISGHISSDEPFTIEIEYWNDVDGATLGTTAVLFSSDGTCIFSSMDNQKGTGRERAKQRGLWQSRCQVPGQWLADGGYSVGVLAWGVGYSLIFQQDELVRLEIYDGGGVRGDYFGRSLGVLRPLLNWSDRFLGEAVPAGAAG